MKKVFDQTVRDIKREVNKKVLKVPGIEQKVLDATSNEPWGPHGTLLADIAHATRNYHEYQMIMAVIWKRINDTGKNWRHVYKGLTVLEYLVAHGSERVIDEIREHAYQISTLSNFQYIDSSGRDQGSNVRKKSQSLVALVNDKERIIEVRQKAAANRDKFRNTSAGAMYRPGSYVDRYEDDRYEGRYGSRDEDRNGYGYGRERDYNYRDDDRYGKYGDSYSRDGDRYGRDNEERDGRDGYRDEEYRGRSQSIDGNGSRSRSSDRGFEEDGQSSSRGSGAKADDQSQDGRRLERKFSEQNIAPPSYEEAVSESRSPAHSERNGETSAATVPGGSSPPAPAPAPAPVPAPASQAASPAANNNQSQVSTPFGTAMSPAGQEVEVADEFDPRNFGSAGPTKAVPAASAVATASSNNVEMDLLGALSDSFSNPLAIMPVSSFSTTPEVDTQSNFHGSSFTATQPASDVNNQSFEDPFGDSPFKAFPSTDSTMSGQQLNSASGVPFQPTTNQSSEIAPAVSQDSTNNFGFGDTFSGLNYSALNVQPTSTNSQFMPQDLSTSHDETDILADILPPTGASSAVTTQAGFPASAGQPAESGASMYGNYNSQAGSVPQVAPNPGLQAPQFAGGNYLPHTGSSAPISNVAPQTPAGQGTPFNSGNLLPQQVSSVPAPQFHSGGFLSTQVSAAPAPHPTATEPSPQFGFLPQQGPTASVVSQAAHSTAAAPTHFNNGNLILQQGSTVPGVSQAAHSTGAPTPHYNNGNFMQQQSPTAPVSHAGYHTPAGSAVQYNNDVLDNQYSRGANSSMSSQPGTSSTGAVVPQPSKDKFETKSTVWADTLSRGLVNLNISGPKINPLADIGVDFDAINRKEKRMEKPTTTAVTSSVTMGKAMGSGSGMGRAGASGLRASPNPMMNSGMGMGAGMGMGMGGGPSLGMGYGGMNQPMGMGMNMGMNQPMGMGMNMGMNMGMGQGGPIQPPGSILPGGYNPMMGTGGYPQQHYGGGYR